MSVATQQVEGGLRKALIYGADRAVRGWDPLLEEADTWVVSSALQNIIEKENFDLILCGCKSKDTAGQVMGAALASRLNLPLVTGVVGGLGDHHLPEAEKIIDKLLATIAAGGCLERLSALTQAVIARELPVFGW